MKKTALLLAVYTVLLICFTACSSKSDSPTNKFVMSEDEKVSFYDELAFAGDVPIIEATDDTALYRIDGDYELLNDGVLTQIINVFNPVYPNLYTRYGKYGNEINKPLIFLCFDATFISDIPANVVDNTININVKWFNNNPDKINVIIYYIAATVLDYNSSAPDWLKSAINYYIAAEYSAYGYNLSVKYNGGDYKNGGQVGACFLRWISDKYGVDIVKSVNNILNTSTWFEEDFWADKTGKTLEQLWAEYKVS